MNYKDDVLSKTLDSKLHHEKNESTLVMLYTKMEKIRLRAKKFMTTGVFAYVYRHFMLLLSVISCIEFIYQTYLHVERSFHRLELHYLNYIEMSVSGLFAIDWTVMFFIADHKVEFFTR